MKKLCSILLLSFGLVFGAAITWEGDDSNDWETGSNWSGGSKPTSSDDVTFDNTATGGCQLTAASVCKTFTMDATWADDFDMNGQTLTVSGNCSINSTDPSTLDGTITLDGASSQFHIGSGVGTVTAASCDLVFNGTSGCVLDDDKGVTFKSLTLGASAVLTSSGGSTSTFSGAGAPLTLGNNASFTVNRKIVLANTTNGGDVTSIGTGTTVDGIAEIQITLPNVANINLPAWTYTGSGALTIQDGGASGDRKLTLTGTLNQGTAPLYIYRGKATNSTTFDANDQDITCGEFRMGVITGATGTFAATMGSGTIDCASFETTTYNANTTTLYFETSACSVSGDFDLGSNTVPVAGTADLIFDGTTSVTLTSAGGTLPDIYQNKTANGVTLSDDLTCLSYEIADGNFDMNGQTFTMSGDGYINSADASTLDDTITLNGASSEFHVGSGVGTVTATSCLLVFNGTTGCVLDNDKGVTFKTLTLGASAVLTSSGTAVSVFAGSGVPLVMGDNSSLTVNGACYFNNYNDDGNLTTIGTGCTVNGTAEMHFGAPNNANNNLPAFTYTGSGIVVLRDLSTSNNRQITLTGTLDVGTAELQIRRANNTNQFTFDANDQDVTCGTLKMGVSAANGALVVNCGSGTWDVASFESTTYNSDTTTLNFETSVCSVGGDFDLGSNTIPVAGAANLIFDGLSAQTFTSAVLDTFNSVSILNSGDTVSTASNFIFNDLSLGANSTLDISGDTLTILNSGTSNSTANFGSDGDSYIYSHICDIAKNGVTWPTIEYLISCPSSARKASRFYKMF